MIEEEFVDTSRISIREINKNIAKEMIIKNHYTHAWSLCNFALGIFYKSNKDSEFFDGQNDDLIGCIIYGNPVGRQAATGISTVITADQVVELTRLWIKDGVGKNVESYCIGRSFEWIRNNYKNYKVILSYSDPEQSHSGKIYQATNFLFLGLNSETNLMPNFAVSLTGPDEGYKWVHSRTVFSRYGSHNIEKLKKAIGHTFYRKKESGKYRYVYFLGNKKERKEFMKSLKYPPKPYPKECNFKLEVQKIEVDENIKKEVFFE